MRAPLTLTILLTLSACGDNIGRPDPGHSTATAGPGTSQTTTAPGTSETSGISGTSEPTPTTSFGTTSAASTSSTGSTVTSEPPAATSEDTRTTVSPETGTNSTSSGTTDATTGSTTGAETDGETEDGICECLANQAPVKTCKSAKGCQEASDCCPDPMPAGFTCGVDYPYTYSCENGVCAYVPCTNDSQCEAYDAYMEMATPNAEPQGCEKWMDCEHVNAGCQYQLPVNNCQTDADCCPDALPTGFTCNDYPYRYACHDNVCVTKGCDSDSQCDAYFDLLYGSDPKYANMGCSPPGDTCFAAVSACRFGVKCQVSSDCCAPNELPAGFTCNDYPYRQECLDGLCASLPCTTDSQCNAYFEATAPEGSVNLGCE